VSAANSHGIRKTTLSLSGLVPIIEWNGYYCRELRDKLLGTCFGGSVVNFCLFWDRKREEASKAASYLSTFSFKKPLVSRFLQSGWFKSCASPARPMEN
jgi:hypothetical protein